MNEAEFLKEIERVNEDLAQRGVPAYQRDFAAFRIMAKGDVGPVLGEGVDPRAYPPYVGPNLFERIAAWNKRRHGPRMNLPSDLWRVPLVLRGDVYLVRIPFPWELDVRIISPLYQVQGMTDNLAASLTASEGMSILKAFDDGLALVYEADDLRTALHQGELVLSNDARLMVKNAIDDRDRAASCLDRPVPDTNGACFNIQQHAEKMLKSFLLAKGLLSLKELKSRQYSHKLPKLLGKCSQASQLFAKVTCDVGQLARLSMSIRYTAPAPAVLEAHDMIWAGLRIGGLAACSISGRARRYGRALEPETH